MAALAPVPPESPTGFKDPVWPRWLNLVRNYINSLLGARGTAVLVAGTKVVPCTTVTAASQIQLTTQAPGGTPGFLYISARVVGVSFTIKSSSATDTSKVAYAVTEPL